ncbi:hypothetical protein [Brumimicrobium oceani]|uniref:Uncharacterized protein n=1 Tax=Brumimicrobium oceani TaxID=2100725 RepID=A0A2U2XD26_9FLAO|nr:hypothetical protein [Brumimicrobium oceani]PWH85611.1 hypothetical protein DIT68_08210 [Brumimicrobium oceani]
MKTIATILLTLMSFTMWAQNFPCINNVSTNPNSPTNSNLPNDIHPMVSYDVLFLNNFDWISNS